LSSGSPGTWISSFPVAIRAPGYFIFSSQPRYQDTFLIGNPDTRLLYFRLSIQGSENFLFR
jgi:hypothetical protein